jgi:hypothetical protein
LIAFLKRLIKEIKLKKKKIKKEDDHLRQIHQFIAALNNRLVGAANFPVLIRQLMETYGVSFQEINFSEARLIVLEEAIEKYMALQAEDDKKSGE